ncbi:MAG TPA: hypothetical protein VFP66_07650 [Candidatus Limnocylindrales bacterium]|nr:hypothetical protein [Candidatus Limnocylindrales bacterium]
MPEDLRPNEPYAEVGLSEAQLRSLVEQEASTLTGDVIGVAFAGRGGVLWHAGGIRLVGPVGAGFEPAVAGLLDGVDLGSGAEVRDVLLSMRGARLVLERVGIWH